MNLLKKLGFTMSRVVKVENELESEEDKKLNEQLAILNGKQSALFAKKLKEHLYVPEQFYIEVAKHADYTNKQWGGRRVSRILSSSFNIVDNEITIGNIQASERKLIESMLVFISFLHIITNIEVLKSSKYQEKCREKFQQILKSSYKNEKVKLDPDIIELIIETAISYQELLPNENLVVDIFKDSAKLDEPKYEATSGSRKLLTKLGNNQVYQAYTMKASVENIGYNFLAKLQDMLKEQVKLIDADIEKTKDSG